MTFTVYYLHLHNFFSSLIVYYLCIDIFEGQLFNWFTEKSDWFYFRYFKLEEFLQLISYQKTLFCCEIWSVSIKIDTCSCHINKWWGFQKAGIVLLLRYIIISWFLIFEVIFHHMAFFFCITYRMLHFKWNLIVVNHKQIKVVLLLPAVGKL